MHKSIFCGLFACIFKIELVLTSVSMKEERLAEVTALALPQ